MSVVGKFAVAGSVLGTLLLGVWQVELMAQPEQPVERQEAVSTPLSPQAEIGAIIERDDLPAATTEAPPAAEFDDPNALSVFFATNRNPVPRITRPDGFGNELGNTTLFGRVDLRRQDGGWAIDNISVEGGNVGRALAAPELLAAAATTGPSILGIEATGPLATFAIQTTSPAADVLAFVHGAGHSFESAVIDAARLADLYRREERPLVPLVFAYPSNGHSTVTGYFADRRDAGMSGLAMAEGFKRMLAFLAEARRHRPLGRQVLIAHSLGAYATRQAVQAIIRDANAPGKVFDVVLIMAGDEDADTLSSEEELRPLLTMTDGVVAYFAANDTLMKLSTLANLRRPIGLGGPSNLAGDNFGDAEVIAVDATEFAAVGDRIRAHSYFLRSPRVVADAKAVIGGERPNSIAGRRQVSDRLFRMIADTQGPILAAPAASSAPEETSIYVFIEDNGGLASPLDSLGQPSATGEIVRLTGGNPREIALQAANQERLGGEILPGRFDEVMVLVPSAVAPTAGANGAGGALVRLPSKAFLDTVLPRGFTSETSPELATTSSQSGTVRLQLVPGITTIAEPVRPTLDQTLGITTWSGRIVATVNPAGATNPATGTITLVYDGQGVSGIVTVNDRTFEIEPVEVPQGLFERSGLAPPANLSEITDVTAEPVLGDEFPREGEEPEDRTEAPILPENQRAGDGVPGSVQSASAPTIDLLFAFTQGAAGAGDIRRAAAEFVERSNLSLELSQIAGRINAVGAEVVSGTEVDDAQTVLNRLRSNDDGHFDEVHARRNELKADGVVLIVKNGKFAGFAGSNVAASNAFLVVRFDHASRHFSLIHEIGHWAGASHDRGANVPTIGWASIMKHMPDAACPPGGVGGTCRRDGHWTDTPRLHPLHGFQLGTRSNAVKLRESTGLQRISGFR